MTPDEERRYRVNWWRVFATMLVVFWLSVGMGVAAVFDMTPWALAYDVIGVK